MTSHFKDILLLGGVQFLLSVFFTCLPDNAVISLIDTAVFFVLVGCLIKLIITKKLAFLNKINQKLPRLSVYLISVGWLTYLTTLTSAILIAINMYKQDLETAQTLALIQAVTNAVYTYAFYFSLIVATYIVFVKPHLKNKN